MPNASEATDPLKAGNQRIKRLRRLVTQRKARSDERAFVIEGPALVAEALVASASGHVHVEDVFVDLDEAELSGTRELINAASSLDLAVRLVTPGVLQTVLDPVAPQPVAAIVSKPVATVASLPDKGLILCLVEARDPGNVGTLIRSAEAAGAVGVVVAGASVDVSNPKAVRASAGAYLRLPVVVGSDVDVILDELSGSGRMLVATVLDDEAVPYDQAPLANAAVLLGNEAHGLPEQVAARADVLATIPLAGPTESLNLAVAGSLFCFEALRQQRLATNPA